jgi:hypothetical protein
MVQLNVKKQFIDVHINPVGKDGNPLGEGVHFDFDISSDVIVGLSDTGSIMAQVTKLTQEVEEEMKKIAELDISDDEKTNRIQKAYVDSIYEVDTLIYDRLLGEGAFEKIYPLFEDVELWLESFPALVQDITVEAVQERQKNSGDLITFAEELKKKKSKKTSK